MSEDRITCILCSDDGGDAFLRKVGRLLSDYTWSHLITQSFKYFVMIFLSYFNKREEVKIVCRSLCNNKT